MLWVLAQSLRAWGVLLSLAWAVVPVQVFGAADAESDVTASVRTLAENTFRTADKDKKGYLDEHALRVARRVLRGALESGLRRNLPGGQKTLDRIVSLVSQREIKAGSDGKITRAQFVAFVEDLMQNRDAILREAERKATQERAAARKAQQRLYRAWMQQLQRQLSQGNRRKRR